MVVLPLFLDALKDDLKNADSSLLCFLFLRGAGTGTGLLERGVTPSCDTWLALVTSGNCCSELFVLEILGNCC